MRLVVILALLALSGCKSRCEKLVENVFALALENACTERADSYCGTATLQTTLCGKPFHRHLGSRREFIEACEGDSSRDEIVPLAKKCEADPNFELELLAKYDVLTTR